MDATMLSNEVARRWGERVSAQRDGVSHELVCAVDDLADVCAWLNAEAGCVFAGLIVEEHTDRWELRYVFYSADQPGWIQVRVHGALAERTFPSISARVHAVDWHEREAEDLFGLTFSGHPRLGDFVLHDDAWQENVAPMRKAFDASRPLAHRAPDANWRPRRIVHAPGAFAMPIGPIYSGVTESVHFLLETVGEDVIRASPRLFYKYRAVEKIAEGRAADDALLLAERFNATTAFAHALAYCQAVESIQGIDVPERAKILRIFIAELERLRHHAGAIQEICESTALVVASSQAGIIEEDLLRLSCELTGHRYLFGLTVCGGLARDFDDPSCRETAERARTILHALDALEKLLRNASSFLDRLEEVGIVSERHARLHGMVGPVARASGVALDLRKVQPYSGYERFTFEAPVERRRHDRARLFGAGTESHVMHAHEREGDGYARLRILFAEARESVRLMDQAAAALAPGPIRARAWAVKSGAALGWTETPRGAAFHWVRLDERGIVARYRIVSPSFANWHGFYLAAEDFAFQDFPIILASFGLSVAENDR